MLAVIGLVVGACGADVPTARPSGSHGGVSPSGSTLGASSDPTSGLPPCKGTNLTATIANWGGTAGSRFAAIVVTSRSGATCTVRGTPGVRLLDGKGKVILDSAKIKGIGGPRVTGADPVVVVGSGDQLAIDIQWTNWCHTQPARPMTVALVLTDRGGLLTAARARQSGADDAPSCTARSRTSSVHVTHAWQGPGL